MFAVTLCQPFAPRSLLASQLLRPTPPSIILLFTSRLLYCHPCRVLWTSQVPVLISIDSLTFTTPVRDPYRVPDLVPVCFCCLLGAQTHQLSHIGLSRLVAFTLCVSGFGSPISLSTLRQFRYLYQRKTRYVVGSVPLPQQDFHLQDKPSFAWRTERALPIGLMFLIC